MTAETCGMSAMPAKVAPPLKSTSTRLSCSGECVITRPSTRVRRNSDLPEPVAPMQRPCGPMPCWADSLMSRWIRPPESPMPIGTRSRSRAGRGRHELAGSKVWMSPRPSSSMWSGLAEVMSTAAPEEASALMVFSGAIRRAKASAVARSHWSMRALTGSSRTRTPSTGSLSSSGRPSANWSRSRVESSSSSQRARHVEQGDAVQAVGRHDVVAGRQVAAVDHEQDVRRRLALVGAEPGPVAEVGRQQVAEVVDRGGDESTRADRVHLARALRVGEPLDPVPVGEVGLGAEDGDHELVGVVEGGGRADHRAGRRAGVLLGTAELDPVEGAQVDRRGQVGLQTVYDEEPVQRGRGRRVDLVDRGALRRDELERQRLRAEAVADVQEVARRPDRAPTGACAPRPATGSAVGSGWCHIRARRCWSAALRATLRMLAR